LIAGAAGVLPQTRNPAGRCGHRPLRKSWRGVGGLFVYHTIFRPKTQSHSSAFSENWHKSRRQNWTKRRSFPEPAHFFALACPLWYTGYRKGACLWSCQPGAGFRGIPCLLPAPKRKRFFWIFIYRSRSLW